MNALAFLLKKTIGDTLSMLFKIAVIVGIAYLLIGSPSCKHEPEVINVPNTQTDTLQQAGTNAGYSLSKPEADNISEAINYVETHNVKPTAQQTYQIDNTEADLANAKVKADAFAKEEGKKDKADFVVSKPVEKKIEEGKINYNAIYYGIHTERTKAISLYVDMDSAGVGYRDDKIQVDVGKKYDDGSLTTRVHYDILTWK